MAVCSFVSLKASYCYYFVFYFILLFFAVYALSIIESAQSEALLSGVKKGAFYSRRHVWNVSKAMQLGALIHTRSATQCISRICTELNKHLPSNTVLPSYCVSSMKSARWYQARCVREYERCNLTRVALSARSFTKRQSGVIHGTLHLSLFNRMCLSVLFFVHHIVWTTSVKE